MSVALRNRPSRLTLSRSRNNGYKSGARRNKRASTCKPVSFRGVSAIKDSMCSIGSWLGALVLGGFFFVCMSAVLYFSYEWMLTTPYFGLQTISVQGNSRVTYERVIASAGVAEGMNSLALNMTEVQAGLSANPWIESAAIKRVLPNAFSISIVERKPRFWALNKGKIYYADQNGILIDEVRADHFSSLPQLEMEPGTADIVARLPELVRGLEDRGMPFKLASAAWVRVSLQKGVELHFEDKNLTLSLGLGDWNANLDRLKLVWTDLVRRRELTAVHSIKAHGSNVWVYKGEMQG